MHVKTMLVVVLVVACLPIAAAQAFGIDGQEAQLIACTHSGYSQARARSCVASTLQGDRLSRAGAHCLEAAGITAIGVIAGGWIGGAAARAIAGGVVGGGGAACIGKLVSS